MSLMVYRSAQPDNIYRLCSLGGHDGEDIAQAFSVLLSAPTEKMGILLDLQNGLPLFPKEGAVIFARQASELGVQKGAVAVLAKPDEKEDMKGRYSNYPQLVEGVLNLEVEVFTSEEKATSWLVELVS